MSKSITFKKLAMCSLTTAAMVAASQGAFAHTRLETPTVVEGTRVHNHVELGHGCHNHATNQIERRRWERAWCFPMQSLYVPLSRKVLRRLFQALQPASLQTG